MKDKGEYSDAMREPSLKTQKFFASFFKKEPLSFCLRPIAVGLAQKDKGNAIRR